MLTRFSARAGGPLPAVSGPRQARLSCSWNADTSNALSANTTNLACEKPETDRDCMLAVILPIHQLVFEVDVAEQPELLPLPELAVSVLRLEGIRRRLSDISPPPPSPTPSPHLRCPLPAAFCWKSNCSWTGQSTEETEAATSVSETASSSSGTPSRRREIPKLQWTARARPLTSSSEGDDAVLCAHTRCHALRASALQMQHPESGSGRTEEYPDTPFTLATTGPGGRAGLGAGRIGAAMYLPVVSLSAFASKLSK